MKKNLIISPVGLKGNQINERIKELMGIGSINENKSNISVELTKLGPDGKAYAIIRENHEWFIKTTDNKKDIVAEDFKYIGGLQNKKSEAYPSYAKAIKHLNMKFKSLAEAYNFEGEINVFENDNLLEHHPLKADQALSATKGMGDNDEYVVDKNGTPLSNEAKEGKEKGQFGDNVADGKVDSEFKKVNEGFAGYGFNNESNLEEVELNEYEAAIEEMMARYDEEEDINEMERFDATAYQEKNNYNPTPSGDKYNVTYEIFYCNGYTCGKHMWHTVDVYAKSEDEAVKLSDEKLKQWEQFAFNGAANKFDEMGEPMFKIESYQLYHIANESELDGNNLGEELHGGQHRLDVAKPKGELTKADFIALNSIEESIKRIDTLLEGDVKKKVLTKK